MRKLAKTVLGAGTAALMTAAIGGPAQAIPALQLYIEGSTYDAGTETWVTTAGTHKLWVIGNVGSESVGTISDLKLAMAFNQSDETSAGSFDVTTTSSKATALGYTDPSTPIGPSFIGRVDDDSPILSNGVKLKALAPHGIYGSGTSFLEFALGIMDKTDSEIGDFITTAPTASGGLVGQINAYTIEVSGLIAGGGVHYDAYGFVGGTPTNPIFAPFSHDAELGAIAEPGTLALFGLSLIGLGRARCRRAA